jgi:hypothetical protein
MLCRRVQKIPPSPGTKEMFPFHRTYVPSLVSEMRDIILISLTSPEHLRTSLHIVGLFGPALMSKFSLDSVTLFEYKTRTLTKCE